MSIDLTRRTALRGMLNGAAITVGVPLLDIMLNTNGEAFAATGAPVPVRFGTWFWGLGVNPSRWFPDKAGPNYDLKPELEPIRALQAQINVLGNFNVPLDGAPNLPHSSGGAEPLQASTPSTPKSLHVWMRPQTGFAFLAVRSLKVQTGSVGRFLILRSSHLSSNWTASATTEWLFARRWFRFGFLCGFLALMRCQSRFRNFGRSLGRFVSQLARLARLAEIGSLARWRGWLRLARWLVGKDG